MKSTFRLRSSAISWSTWAPRRTHRNYERRYDGSDVNVWKDANKQIHNFCLKLKGKLSGVFTHPVYACLFLITLRFPSKYVGWLNQGTYSENATLCRKRMRKRDVGTRLYFKTFIFLSLSLFDKSSSPKPVPEPFFVSPPWISKIPYYFWLQAIFVLIVFV